MVEFHDGLYGNARPARSVARWTRRLIGVGCLLAIPGVWMSVGDAFPEARIFGLAVIIILMGVAGLCFLGRR